MADGGLAGYVEATKLSELASSGRVRVTVQDRVLALFQVNGRVYALDHFCYHTGGPLSMGDIEDSHGRLCVVCPWHKHTITLDTGESLYTSIDPQNPRNIKHNCSKGVKQRTHHVQVLGDSVYIKLSDTSHVLDSDRYFSKEYKVFMQNALTEPSPEYEHAVKVPIHSRITHLPRK